MKKTIQFAAAIAIAAGLSACAQDKADAPAAADKKPIAQQPAPASPYDWRPVFDGKTLTGWTKTDFAGGAEPRVEAPSLILPAGDMLTGVTYTGKDLPKMNYEVSMEAQRVDGADFFVGLTVPVNEACVSLVLGGWGGTVCGISSLDGGDAANNETTKSIDFKNKQWYRVRMRVLPTRLQAWVDEEQIVDARTKGRSIDVRLEVEPSKPFGLASFQSTAAIRDLKIRQLKEEETIVNDDDE
jgi:hypothetical protein